MSRARAPWWGLALALAPLGGCDRLVNRYGRGDDRGCELGLFEACRRAANARASAAATAAPWRQRGCDLGDYPQCSDLGAFLYTTDPPRRDRARAGALWASACAHDVGVACRNLGVSLLEGGGDRAVALGHFEKGCSLGDGAACTQVGDLVSTDDPARARVRYDRACSLQSEEGCGGAGLMRVMHDPKDFSQGRVLLARGCVARHALSCFNLAITQRDGGGGAPDVSSARQHFDRACELGYAPACIDSTVLAYRAARTPAERVASLAGVRRGCSLGSLRACGLLGAELLTQGSTREHFVESEAALRRACDGGEWPACNDLAVGIQRGRFAGTPEAAAALLRGACEHGVRVACEAAAGGEEAPRSRRRRRRHRRGDG